MSLILTTAIEKGGTGKTTTVVNLAALMAAEGKRVLVVDMDQQANTTYMLTQHKKAENFYKGHGLVNMFMNFDLGGMDLTPYIHPTNVEGVHIIPSTAQTPRAVHQLDLLADEYKMKNYTFLIHCLANINDDYDYAIEVRSHDSIAVWVDITPRFQDSDDPVLVTDRLMFTLESGVVQQVVLQAVTQDVNVMEHVLLDKDTCLSSRRPYFVKDTLRVAEGSTLTISPGVRMLFAPKAGMLVEGTLVARGERDSYCFAAVVWIICLTGSLTTAFPVSGAG